MTPSFAPAPAPAPVSDTPQYAIFEDSKKDADSLPAMPSWEGAQTKKILIEDDSVEMEPLKKTETQNMALSTNNLSHPTTPSPVSPDNRNPYGPPPAQGGPNGYMAPARAGTDPYSANGQGYDHYDYNGYGQARHDNSNQGYGMAAVGAMRSQTPQQDYNNGYNNGYGRGADQGYPQSRTPRPYDEYGRSGTPGAPPSYRTAPSVNNAYNNPARMGSPGPGAAYGYDNPNRMRSPGPQIGFEYPQRSQTATPSSYNRHPAPYRQYSNDSSRPLVQPTPVSPIQNTGGFDFSSGYSRPSTATPVQTAPAQAANGGTAYPGYRTYRPPGGGAQQQDSWNGA
ncbi:uncharacterized protein F4807DRAFT_429314 [Annulohypoxylon truncatum]|uniref:uncharacterized protein n=1 Tax=Annulohypoxylon truncatum TaxID=327061 RepID=UPI0020075AD5|nr:uncharacterized protein F4807DRAFT_429314 [Annulohypoxylon truncatum]KAI1208766.1 hypothetical protein F4807DRAFT_429314 [Annulohypoxylon truncatum]